MARNAPRRGKSRACVRRGGIRERIGVRKQKKRRGRRARDEIVGTTKRKESSRQRVVSMKGHGWEEGGIRGPAFLRGGEGEEKGKGSAFMKERRRVVAVSEKEKSDTKPQKEGRKRSCLLAIGRKWVRSE